MKAKSLLCLLFIGFVLQVTAQRNRCGSAQYMKLALFNNPSLQITQQRGEQFIQSHTSHSSTINARPAENIITIPVVVHVVYNLPAENISDQAIQSQLDALNRDYRRNNADSINTPSYFKGVAADAKIEFKLAKVDPNGLATTGIERISSPVAEWISDDHVKYKSQYGANGWDADSYLNIWVCHLHDLLGYASIMGQDKAVDGVVINYDVFDDINDGGPYNSGRTAVHEIGHWLSLKHLWGDADCGDDDVSDTPKQSTYTAGCPGGIHISCGNTPNGDMYMNYMDYTNDPCMNLFTNGQRDRMRSLFDNGGYRNSILSSRALGEPWAQAIPLPGVLTIQSAKVFPNPTSADLTLDMSYDETWVGKNIIITNVAGQVLLQHIITSKTDKLNISAFKQGIYFIRGENDIKKLSMKFVKL